MKMLDAVVIGGGPAGLSAAIYLGRYNRSVAVFDRQDGRWNTFETNDNYLGFPKGIPSRELRKLGKKQAIRFGAQFFQDKVIDIQKKKEYFLVIGREKALKSRALVMATGVTDFYPSFRNFEEYIGRSLFWCIICDGYKTRNKKIVIVGHDDKAVTSCMQFLNFTKKISFLTNSNSGEDEISKKGYAKLKKSGVKVYKGSIEKVIGKNGMMERIITDCGEVIYADYMFSKQGSHPNSDLASKIGLTLEGEGYIKTDYDQRTNVPFVYAAGDVTSELVHQVVTATHEGATAAISLNEDLLLPFQKEV